MQGRPNVAARWANVALLLLGLGGCEAGVEPGAQGSCERDGDCDVGVCGLNPDGVVEDLEPLELRCGPTNDGADVGAPCDGADDCERGLCLVAGACAAACTADADCASGQRCQAVFARTAPQTLQPLDACVDRVSLPGDARVTATRQADALSGGTDTIELTLDGEPALFVLEHLQDDRWPRSAGCRPPLCPRALRELGDGSLLWDADAVPVPGDPPAANPVGVGTQVMTPTVLVPNGEVDVGTLDALALDVVDEVAGDLRVTRLIREPGGPRLDLNVFYVGALDWQPTGSRGPPELEAALEEVDRIFAQADIFIGEVRQNAVEGALLQRGATFPEGDPAQGFQYLETRFGVLAELPALFALSAGAANTAINLFFVADVAAADGELEGLSGGIPGPLGMHGLGSSGIVFATDMMQGDPRTMGRTLAHEIGHHLGLFHTSEADGVLHDPLADTVECAAARDANGDRLVSAQECADGDAGNLMFWAKTSGTALTPGQAELLRRALILR